MALLTPPINACCRLVTCQFWNNWRLVPGWLSPGTQATVKTRNGHLIYRRQRATFSSSKRDWGKSMSPRVRRIIKRFTIRSCDATDRDELSSHSHANLLIRRNPKCSQRKYITLALIYTIYRNVYSSRWSSGLRCLLKSTVAPPYRY